MVRSPLGSLIHTDDAEVEQLAATLGKMGPLKPASCSKAPNQPAAGKAAQSGPSESPFQIPCG